jgi:type I restriction enzyme M protein
LGNSLGDVGAKLKPAHVILTNPPFGTSKGGNASVTRDFTFATNNKQLCFLQHIYRNLRPGGRAAVVLPDNVLFESGVGTQIRRDLMDKCNLHTILRLPTGIFYAQGVKTNVLFFTRGTVKNPDQDENCTKEVWVYDLRANMASFGKRTPFGIEHLKPFEKLYGSKPDGTSKRTEGDWSFTDKTQDGNEENNRWRRFDRAWIADTKGDSLDISWIKDADGVDGNDIPDPAELAREAMAELEGAMAELKGILAELGEGVEK